MKQSLFLPTIMNQSDMVLPELHAKLLHLPYSRIALLVVVNHYKTNHDNQIKPVAPTLPMASMPLMKQM